MAKITTYDVEGTLEDYNVLREKESQEASDLPEAIFLMNQDAMSYAESGAEVIFKGDDRFFLVNDSNRVYRMVDASE